MMLDAEFGSFAYLGTEAHKLEIRKQNEEARQRKETKLRYKIGRYLENHFFGAEGREAMQRRTTKLALFI